MPPRVPESRNLYAAVAEFTQAIHHAYSGCVAASSIRGCDRPTALFSDASACSLNSSPPVLSFHGAKVRRPTRALRSFAAVLSSCVPPVPPLSSGPSSLAPHPHETL
ncbi:hypothetical protein VTH06DRAFT_735 [Thermothelomyces fergusii]